MLLAALLACRALTEPPDESYCRQLNAFTADTAEMHVGATRQFEAVGFVASGTAGVSCIGVMRGGFEYSTDVPAVATVEVTTGIVSARATGSTPLRASRELNGVTYRGMLTIYVVP